MTVGLGSEVRREGYQAYDPFCIKLSVAVVMTH